MIFPQWWRSALLETRATVLAGVWLGALVGGGGGRLGMLLLRLLSPDSVHGVISDDGFRIGQVTLGGTYGLILIGAGIGVVGAAGYRLVDRWLIGPGWFRQTTAALGAGAVVGSMLVHADGVDFRLLHPLGLAIFLFVLIPALFGFFIGPLEKALARPDAWPNRGRRGWIVPVVSLAVFPPVAIVAAFVSAITLTLVVVGQAPVYATVRDNRAIGFAIRAVWLGVAILGAVSLASDAQEILS